MTPVDVIINTKNSSVPLSYHQVAHVIRKLREENRFYNITFMDFASREGPRIDQELFHKLTYEQEGDLFHVHLGKRT